MDFVYHDCPANFTVDRRAWLARICDHFSLKALHSGPKASVIAEGIGQYQRHSLYQNHSGSKIGYFGLYSHIKRRWMDSHSLLIDFIRYNCGLLDFVGDARRLQILSSK